jgi:DNA-binding transcriptional MocR family regulator
MTKWFERFDRSERPHHKHIASLIAQGLASGELQPGDKLPTHRALADELNVTVGTVTRGYAEAEKRGLIVARTGSGTFVRSSETEHDAEFGIPPESEAPGAINFALSYCIPAYREQALAESLQSLAQDPKALHYAVSYQPEFGLERHRRILTEWFEHWGQKLDPEETLITLGGLHSVHIALQALVRPGGAVASASLTYPGIIAATRQQGLRHCALEMDAEGIRPDSFEALCHQQCPQVLYCTPNQNNPTTACMGYERRQALLHIAARHGVWILEDDIHLVSADERPPNLVEMDPERVLYISGCSKVMAGGLRVGVLRGPASLMGRLGDSLRSHCWMAPPLNAEIACRWISSGRANELMSWQRGEIGHRQALAANILANYTYQSQPYGFNLWLHLPEPWRPNEFVAACEREGVLIRSGEPFAVGRSPVPPAVRLCLSAEAHRETVEKGLRTVESLLKEQPPAAPNTI